MGLFSRLFKKPEPRHVEKLPTHFDKGERYWLQTKKGEVLFESQKQVRYGDKQSFGTWKIKDRKK